MTDDPEHRRRKSLAEHGLLNRSPESVVAPIFAANEFFDPDDIVQVRYEMLRGVRTGVSSAAHAAASHGVSRATYYQVLASFEREGVAGLIPLKRGPRGAHKLTDEVLDFVDGQLDEDPRPSSSELARRIEERFGVSVHPRSVERALERRAKKKRQRPSR